MYKRQGTVYIKELSAPAGYKVDSTVYSLNVEAGKTATLNVSDTPKVTDTLIELFKIDIRDHLALDEIGIYLEKKDISEGPEAVARSLYDYMARA